MEGRFSRINFLKEGLIDPTNRQPPVHQGGFCDVQELNLPDEIKKIPKGYVIKRYRNPEYDTEWTDLLNLDPWSKTENKKLTEEGNLLRGVICPMIRRGETKLMIEKDYEKLREKNKNLPDYSVYRETYKKYSVFGLTERFQRRHKIIRQYFSPALPDLIVPTQFIIGEERDEEKSQSRRYVYEIQKKINPFDIGTSFVFFDDRIAELFGDAPFVIAQNLKKIYEKQIDNVKKELEILIAEIEKIIEVTGYCPYDILNTDNLKFTPDGLRVIDTNGALEVIKGEETQAEPFLKIFNIQLIFWREVIKLL